MIRFRQAMRLLYINAVLIRHGLDEIILTTPLLRPVRFLLYLLPWNWVRRHRAPRAVRLRRALEDLVPIFVKFGPLGLGRPDNREDSACLEEQCMRAVINILAAEIPDPEGDVVICGERQACGFNLDSMSGGHGIVIGLALQSPAYLRLPDASIAQEHQLDICNSATACFQVFEMSTKLFETGGVLAW